MIPIRPDLESHCTHSGLTDIVCKVCKTGKIYEQIFELKRTEDKEWGWSETNYHCNTCGVKYEFLPEQELKEPLPYQYARTSGLVQTSPPLPQRARELISENLELGRQIAKSIKK